MSRSTKASKNRREAESSEEVVGDFRSTKLYSDWYESVASGTPNDYLILISAHPGYTGTSGAGKSTLAAGLARELHIEGMAEEWAVADHYTLDIEEFAYRTLPVAADGSAILGDEMQGTVANTNLNKMRTQKTEQLEALAAIAGDRKNRKTKILVFQTLSRVNPYLFDFVDSWLLIVDDNNYVANHYKVMPKGVFDLSSSSGLKTPRVERITWDPLPMDDERYQAMEVLKDQANQGRSEFIEEGEEEPEETMPKSVRDETMRKLYEQGVTQQKLAHTFDLTQPTVSEIVNQ